MALNDFLTVGEIAKIMGLDEATIRGYIAPSSRLKPKLKTTKLNPRLNLIARAEFEAWRKQYRDNQDKRNR